MNDDYLWDRSGPVDPDVAALEEKLGPYRFRPDRGGTTTEREPGRSRLPWAAGLAAAALALVAVGLTWIGPQPPLPYRVELLQGSGAERRALCGGDSLACDEGTRARIHVGDIGSVELSPQSRLRIEPGAHDESSGYRLFLERGTLSASIFSAPRVFQVGTPSGIAVDLGCIYSTTVSDDGRTTLRVETGAVSFEGEGRRVHVPSGAECLATPARGPGTPVWTDRTPDFKTAVERLDASPKAGERDLAFLRSIEDPRDSLTLFHLLVHTDRDVRKQALDRILVLVDDLPETFDPAAVMRGDRSARDALGEELEWRW